MDLHNQNVEADSSVTMTAGEALSTARKSADRTSTDIAAQTKIPERHILAIEESRYADLPGRSYAFGFARTYARAVGLDPIVITEMMRAEINTCFEEPCAPATSLFTPGDPTRIPSKRTAWIAALLGIILASAGLLAWNFLSPSGETLTPTVSDTNKLSPITHRSAPVVSPVTPTSPGLSASLPTVSSLPASTLAHTSATSMVAPGNGQRLPYHTSKILAHHHRPSSDGNSGNQSASVIGGVLPPSITAPPASSTASAAPAAVSTKTPVP